MGSPIKGKQIGTDEITDREASVSTPVEITDSTNAAGSSTALIRADHQHAHGSRGGAALHAAATTSVNGFMSSADKTKLDTLQDAAGLDVKEVVRVATVVAGTLATSFANGQTVDGVVLSTGDRILIKNQAAGAENGIYIVEAAGAPTRAGDMPATASCSGAIIGVDQGTQNQESIWFCTNDKPNDIAGTDALTFGLQSQLAPVEQQEEIATEAITGSDTAMSATLSATPKYTASVELYLNGVHQQQGAGEDYTISGTTITWLASSGTAVDMEVTDTLIAKYVS